MQDDDKNGVSEPSRRRLLKGMGALGGALALTGDVRSRMRKRRKARRGPYRQMHEAKRSPFMARIRRGS